MMYCQEWLDNHKFRYKASNNCGRKLELIISISLFIIPLFYYISIHPFHSSYSIQQRGNCSRHHTINLTHVYLHWVCCYYQGRTRSMHLCHEQPGHAPISTPQESMWNPKMMISFFKQWISERHRELKKLELVNLLHHLGHTSSLQIKVIYMG